MSHDIRPVPVAGDEILYKRALWKVLHSEVLSFGYFCFTAQHTSGTIRSFDVDSDYEWINPT